MKTEEQIRTKIIECEEKISKNLDNHSVDLEIWVGLKYSRASLLWVLSNEDRIEPDELTKKIDYEILCIESTKIF